MICFRKVRSQEDRPRQSSVAKSYLTSVLPRSDNGWIRPVRRRKSFCGLQLDGFFGAMLCSSRDHIAQVVTEWSEAEFPSAADQTDLPVMAGLCCLPGFLNWNHRAPRYHFAQPACCEVLSSSIFSCTDWDRVSNRRSSAELRHCSKFCP